SRETDRQTDRQTEREREREREREGGRGGGARRGRGRRKRRGLSLEGMTGPGAPICKSGYLEKCHIQLCKINVRVCSVCPGSYNKGQHNHSVSSIQFSF